MKMGRHSQVPAHRGKTKANQRVRVARVQPELLCRALVGLPPEQGQLARVQGQQPLAQQLLAQPVRHWHRSQRGLLQRV